MQPRSAERKRALSWDPASTPRSPPPVEPHRGSVTRTAPRPRHAPDGTALRSKDREGDTTSEIPREPRPGSTPLGCMPEPRCGSMTGHRLTSIHLPKPNGLASCSPGVPSASERSPGTPHPPHDPRRRSNPIGVPSPERPRDLATPLTGKMMSGKMMPSRLSEHHFTHLRFTHSARSFLHRRRAFGGG